MTERINKLAEQINLIRFKIDCRQAYLNYANTRNELEQLREEHDILYKELDKEVRETEDKS